MSILENFLTEFHNMRPGLTAKAFGALPVTFRGQRYGSSYEVLAAAIPRIDGAGRLLDLACGDGLLLALLEQRCQPGLALSGVDLSSSELAVARMRLPRTVDLRQSRAQDLPYVSESLDYVLSHLALMLMDDAELVLREVHRVLKPGAAFVTIIGAAPPPTLAFTAYVTALSRHPRQTPFAGLQFGDRRFHSVDGIHELLAPGFRHISVEEIRICRRLAPNELWCWFLDMYDLQLLDETDRRAVEREFIAAVTPHRGSDGKLDYLETLRYVSAVA
jgi:ubiquinone/menaquinone biosynthesis C-methylase UbiE